MRNACARFRTLSVRSLHTVLLAVALAVGLATLSTQAPSVLGYAGYTSATDAHGSAGIVKFDPYIQTELYFGTTKPDGVVTDAEFQAFLDQEITPRFPDGLTLLTGYGQYRNSQGIIARETSKVLILLYPVTNTKQASIKIEQIRAIYEDRFDQESVLRVDQAQPVRVSF